MQCSNRQQGKNPGGAVFAVPDESRTPDLNCDALGRRGFGSGGCLQLPVGDVHNMTVSWRGRLRADRAQPGGGSMMVVLLIAGIGIVLVGLLSIGFGIPVKEF